MLWAPWKQGIFPDFVSALGCIVMLIRGQEEDSRMLAGAQIIGPVGPTESWRGATPPRGLPGSSEGFLTVDEAG